MWNCEHFQRMCFWHHFVQCILTLTLILYISFSKNPVRYNLCFYYHSNQENIWYEYIHIYLMSTTYSTKKGYLAVKRIISWKRVFVWTFFQGIFVATFFISAIQMCDPFHITANFLIDTQIFSSANMTYIQKWCWKNE